MNRLGIFIACLLSFGALHAASVRAAEFRTTAHPRVYFTADDVPALRAKAAKTPWAAAIVKGWHKNVDAHVARQAEDPTFAPSRLMMHWGEGRHYTQFTTDGNFVTGRSGNAPEPTIRVAYARSEERHRLLLLSAVHSRDRDAAPFAGELRRVLSDGRGAKCRAFEGSG